MEHLTDVNRFLLASVATYHFRPVAKGKETGRGACALSNYIRAASCVTRKCDPMKRFDNKSTRNSSLTKKRLWLNFPAYTCIQRL